MSVLPTAAKSKTGASPPEPRGRQGLFVSLAVFVLICALGGVYLHFAIKAARKSVWDSLTTIADMKAGQVASWYRERLADAEVFAKTPILIRQGRELLKAGRPLLPSQEFHTWLATLQKEYRYSGVILYNAEGSPVMTMPADLQAKNRSLDPYFQSALRSNEVIESGLRHAPDVAQTRRNIRLEFWIPIGVPQETGKLAEGALLLQADPNDFLYPLIESWPVPTSTAETLILRVEGKELVYLSELRHRKNSALNFRRPLPPALQDVAERVFQGQDVISEGLDYRQVPVLAVIRKIPGTRWVLVAKVDQDEIYAPVRERAFAIVTVTGLLGASTLLGATALLRRRKLDRLKHQMARERQAEQAVRDSEEKFRTIFETANDAILMLEGSFIVECNSRALETFGCASKDDILHHAPEDFSPPVQPDGCNSKEKAIEYLKKAQDGQPQRFYWKNQRKDGSPFDAEVSLTGLELRGKLYVQGIVRDVTDRKQAEAALLNAKTEAEMANQAKDHFIAVLSHELRTPLTPVLLAVTDLESEPAIPKDAQAELRRIRSNVELETRLIDDLLDVTRISRGALHLRREVVDVPACLRNALDICQSEINQKHLSVSLKIEGAPARAWADESRLQQVFWNILRNAAKFTPEKGEICIRCFHADGLIRIEFTDTGVGIEPAALPQIFNAFHSSGSGKVRRFGGLGLGLSIAKKLMDLHQGKISAFSEGSGKGSTFVVEIASIPDADIPEIPPAPKPLPSGNRQNILLVEDNPDTLRILAKMLQKWGYTVTTANCVKAALEEASKEPFEILVSDIGLPDGTGLEIMRYVNDRYHAHGIAISGFGTDDDIRQSHDAGFGEHLVKPVNTQDLSAAIQRVRRN